MPIASAPSLYLRLKNGKEGGLEFAPLMDLLLLADSKALDYPFTAFDDDETGRSVGVDSFAGRGKKGGLVGYRYRFLPSPLSAQQKRSAEVELERACEQFPDLEKWVLVTPEDFTKRDSEWLERLEYRFRSAPGRKKPASVRRVIAVEHWGHTEIARLMVRYPHIVENFFPEIAVA